MKNSSITDKLQTQKQKLKVFEQNFASEKKKIVDIQTDENTKTQTSEVRLSPLFFTLPPVTDINHSEGEQLLQSKKKKKQRPKLR